MIQAIMDLAIAHLAMVLDLVLQHAHQHVLQQQQQHLAMLQQLE